jgi:putative CRISPR-associated protein (TIGR02619 family)
LLYIRFVHPSIHFLIATDTALGRIAAGVVCTFLREQGLTVDLYVPPRLSTTDTLSFSHGIKDLIHWCESTIPGYREAKYRVIFNLTGAFKSLQGYLNIVGMFYADELVYIFETGSQLLSIPRLPLQIDVEALNEYRVELALMAQGYIYPLDQIAGIPAGLLEIDQDGNACVSDWGLLIWNRVRRDLLGNDLLPFPRLQYTERFRKDFRQADIGQKTELQETLAKVSSMLESYHGNTSPLKQDGGLQYDDYTNLTTNDGRRIGHFRITLGYRVSCTVEDGALRLRRFGKEEVVNKDP